MQKFSGSESGASGKQKRDEVQNVRRQQSESRILKLRSRALSYRVGVSRKNIQHPHPRAYAYEHYWQSQAGRLSTISARNKVKPVVETGAEYES
jgi:hypothetical protein